MQIIISDICLRLQILDNKKMTNENKILSDPELPKITQNLKSYQKFPSNDKNHSKSKVNFFNHCDPIKTDIDLSQVSCYNEATRSVVVAEQENLGWGFVIINFIYFSLFFLQFSVSL